MKEIAADTIRATFMKLDPKKREFTFEVFYIYIIQNRYMDLIS